MSSLNENTDSSSEDEVENQRLLDAVWDQNQNIKDEDTSRRTLQEKPEESSCIRKKHTFNLTRPSVREMINQESHNQFSEDHKNVKASQEFKNFMAKKLSSLLDGNLKMILSKKQNAFGNENSEENEGDTLRLFSSSRCALNLDSPQPAPSIKRPRIGRNTKKLFQANKDQDSDSDVEDQRLAEAAISGHQILSFAAFSPSFYQTVETFNKDDTDDAPHMKSMRTTNGSDCALNQSKDKIKNRKLKEDDYFEEVVKKKKKVDTNTDDGDEKVDEENGQSGVVGPLLHSRQNDQYGQLHHVDNYSYSKHKKKEKKCKPRKDYKQSVEEEHVKAGSGKYLLNEKSNSHSEEAVDQRRKKKKVKKEKKELK